mgnify:CR=1 FL=1
MKKFTIRYQDLLSLFSMNKTLSIIFPIVLTASFNINAEEAVEANEDCGEAEIRYSDNPELTRAERIALMEKAFFDSVNRFESCNLSDPNNTSAAGSDGGDSGEQGGGENQGGNAGNHSVASQEMQGTEAETEMESSMPAQAGTADSVEQTDSNGAAVVSRKTFHPPITTMPLLHKSDWLRKLNKIQRLKRNSGMNIVNIRG